MKKLLVAGLCLFAFVTWTDLRPARPVNWNKETVRKCLKATTVVITTVPKGEYLGTGVVIDKYGTALTAAHVVSHTGMVRILMVTAEGQEYDAEVLLANQAYDLALIRPRKSAHHFQFAKIQESDDIWPGEEILVIGHPFSNFYTVTTGIISKLTFDMWYRGKVMDITALVNPGNSGGPIFNKAGEVLGIVSAMRVDYTRTPTGIGIGVPVAMIHKFLREWERVKTKRLPIKTYRIGDIK